jgi:hypothetical protein
MGDAPRFYTRPGLNSETYDAQYAALLPRTPVDGDVEWYLARCREWGGAVLEGACGTGRVTWPLAEGGVEVVGFDRSGPMLALAEAKRASASPAAAARARFLRADLVDFDLGRRFRTALVTFRAFQCLLEPGEQRACLDRFRDHLEPGGRLVLDLFDPRYDALGPRVPADFGARPPFRHPGRPTTVSVAVERDSVDPVRQVLHEVWTFREQDADGTVLREEREALLLRWSFRWELRHLFALAGFEVEAEHSDFRGSPPAYAREQVWVLRRA